HSTVGSSALHSFPTRRSSDLFLTVIYNNQVWNASLNAARGLYPEGVAARTRNFPGTDLSPSPNFELTAQACGAYAARVEEPGELDRKSTRLNSSHDQISYAVF